MEILDDLLNKIRRRPSEDPAMSRSPSTTNLGSRTTSQIDIATGGSTNNLTEGDAATSQGPPAEAAPQATTSKVTVEPGGRERTVSVSEPKGEKHPDAETDSIAEKPRERSERGKSRSLLPDKPQDFQVRVKVIEGRALVGANISPVVRVSMVNQTRQTKVKGSTNKPYYDETFFINVNMSPPLLFDEAITFEVFNSRRLRSNALLGSFKSDIGFFYDEPSHAVIRKWLLLTDPDDKMAGIKGYLKVTVIVLGQGDEAPTDEDVTEDADDIESNLLQPSGVELRPATFSLKVFRAEDLPQMDPAFFENVKNLFSSSSEPKELVDPFVQFCFAGKKVKSRIHEKCDHPEFNEELNLGFRFPSMCEKIKLQLFDWDQLSADDCIGTILLPLPMVSGQGDEGFLPMFGPTFVNMYGSTREFSDLPDEFEELNLGVGEGVTYRGRVLVELETKLGELPDEDTDDLPSDEIIRIQPFLRRRKYKLFACFLEATMISTTDDQIMFEVSIGNYGNTLDTSVPPSSSTTNPTNAVFDGCYYYYLPWSDSKPCVSVDSHWEDIAFRFEPLNILTRMCERLEENLEKVELSIDTKAPAAETALVLISCLDQLITDCKKPLPTFDEQQLGVNSLDFKIQTRRLREMKAIVNEATLLRDGATDANEALEDIRDFHQRLRNLAVEPQNSMPDVEIWMLSGNKRIAYSRIPAYDVLYSPNADACGKDNRNILDILLKYPGKKGQDIEDFPEVPAQVRLMVWLGLEKHQDAWNDRSGTEGDFCVYAETYENQISVLGKWTKKGMQRPAWSNLKGDLRLPKETFVCPPGWKWEGEFFVNPELGMEFDTDSGHKTFVEDVFDNESRVTGGSWGCSSIQWTDMYGNATTARDEIHCPTGWQWTSEWVVDTNRAVDENGFEYSVEPTLSVSYGPVEKNYHLCRRRRWVRSRKLVNEEEEEAKEKELAAEGWEYAPMFSMKFHLKERKTDLVRRRRWHRKMKQEDPSAPAVFRLEEQKGKEAIFNAPRMFITFDNAHKFQLRVYIYQGRDLRPSDPDGFSDPYARVAIVNQSQVTDVKFKTLCPTWDQTLIFDDVMIYGSVELTALNPPNIVIELFDKDTVGRDEFMGRCMVEPVVKLKGQEPPAPRLLWYDLWYGDQEAGEILAAFELFLDEGADLPYPPTTRNHLYIVPDGIRPVMQRTAIEVLCWGVRNMKKFQLANVSSPSVELEVGDHVVQSSVIKNTKKNPNFDQPLYFFDIYLPKEELYTPPLNIKVRDNRSFGRRPIVGLHSMKTLQPYRCAALGTEQDEFEKEADARSLSRASVHTIEIKEEEEKGAVTLEDDIDWWSKFYVSLGEEEKAGEYLQKGYDSLMVYKTALEKVEPFSDFQDFVKTFPVHRGKVKANEQATVVGEFKGTFRVYPLPDDPNAPLPPRVIRSYPPNDPTECLIRVYVIRALDLQPQDENGLADPYLKITLGKNKINDREHYVPNQLNPIFGRMFEMSAILPIEKDLKVCVYDYDLISRDDVVGETIIDLENRFLTRYRATCGLPQTYCTSGINKWRDSKTPKELLDQFCESHQMAKPQYLGNSQLVMESTIYDLQDFEEGITRHNHFGPSDERLALYVLNSLPLVPEHVETRPLYNTLQPGIEQGKIQLWVDIFPKFLGEPGSPFNIAPREPNSYELRVIIWNTSDVIADEVSITGEEMSDIYVKGWLAGIDKKQKTDVHYRSLDGEGNFNWRFVFPFLYLPAERVMVVKKKAHFWSLDETEEHLPPTLCIQIWDNDLFSPDDYLGNLEMNLNRMPKPAKRAKSCGLKQLQTSKGNSQKAVETVSVFEMKSVYGWWPAITTDGDEPTIAGKLEMTIELLTSEEAETKPAGKARDEPNQNPTLDPPNRPATSFLWFTSPLKTLRHIIWKRYKCLIIALLVILLVSLLLVLFIYSAPGYLVKKIFRA